MGILALAADERVATVEVTADELSVRLMDGRTISVPLVWYPRLMDATPAQREGWEISGGGYGVHWREIDEDLSTEGLLRGAPAPRQVLTAVKAQHQRHEHTVSRREGGDVEESVIEDEKADEKGFLDHLQMGKKSSRQSKALDGMVSNMEEIESFALGTSFLIDEKFGNRFSSDDKTG